jgi:outer membrane receptor protein involved in Fe transport
MPYHEKSGNKIKRPCLILLACCGFFAPPIYGSGPTGGKGSIFDLSLGELMNLNAKVEVASLFEEDELLVGSSVVALSPTNWDRMGSRRMHEVFDNEPGVMTYTLAGGIPAIAIRGYTTNFSSLRGLATMIDGIPLNTISFGTAFYTIPNWELGTLNKVEMLKGPASAIYGSDAFHGVIAMNTFESDKDLAMVEAGGGNPSFFQGNVKLSKGFANNKFRVDFTAGGSRNGDENLIYEPEAGGPGRWNNQYNSYATVLKFSLKVNDRLKIKLGAYANGFDSSGFKGVGTVLTTNDLFLSGYDSSDAQMSFYMGTLSLVYALPYKMNLEFNGYSWKSHALGRLNFLDFAHQTYQPGHTLLNFGGDDVRRGFTLAFKQPDNRYRLQWLVAYSYSYFDVPDSRYDMTDVLSGKDYFFPNIPTGKLLYNLTNRTINSVFAQTRWGIIPERLYLLLGVRYDHYSDVETGFTPRVGLIYQPSKNSAIKALYGRAFRAPVAGELKGAFLTLGNPDLKPEKIDTYELIYLRKQKQSHLQLNGFYSKWGDGIFFEGKTGLPAGYTSEYVNKSKSVAYGI